MAKNSVLEATRLLLQSSAKVYYRGLSEDAKSAVRASFFAADKRGEGRISFRDFLDSGSSLQDSVRVGLFRFLDADGNGFLELDEFITLHYINESGTFYCSSCGIPILIGGYSCTACPPPGRDSFDICLSCYTSPTPHHHPRTSFVNLVASYHQSGAKHSTMPSNNVAREAAYINESGLFTCDCCGLNIVTDRYTCKECVNSFDLCLSCYVSRPPYFRHHHPFSSFVRKVQSQANAAAAAAAAEAAAAVAAMNANMAMHADMAAAAAMNQANMAMSANMAAMSAATMNANIAAMGQLNQNLYPTYAPPVQNNSKLNVGVDLITKLVGLSMQSGLLN